MWMNYTEVSSKNLLFENIKSCCKYFFSISQDTILITIIFSITEPIKKHVDQTKYIPHRKKRGFPPNKTKWSVTEYQVHSCPFIHVV